VIEPTTVLVDGAACDSISIADRGLAFGDGVFRTLAVRAGQPLNWRWHLRRLLADCETLRLAPPAEETVLDEIRRVAPADAAVKVIVTRGSSGRGYGAKPGTQPTRVVAAFPLPAHLPSNAHDGVRVRRCTLVASEQPRVAGAKTLNRLDNVLARSEWDDPSIAEGLVADGGGRVVEGTMSNLFIATLGRVFTPDLSRCGVIGAQRERVRELLRASGIECAVCDLRWGDLEAAEEVFLTNSLIGLWPVNALEGREWPVGPIARRMQALIASDDARH
jgi:4-amino-4-deoxychorismate lyase